MDPEKRKQYISNYSNMVVDMMALAGIPLPMGLEILQKAKTILIDIKNGKYETVETENQGKKST